MQINENERVPSLHFRKLGHNKFLPAYLQQLISGLNFLGRGIRAVFLILSRRNPCLFLKNPVKG